MASLFETCAGRHEITPDFDTDSSPIFQAWMQRLDPAAAEFVASALRSSAQSEARETVDCVVELDLRGSDWSADPPRVGPEEILPVLHAPLTILVENEINDGAFLRTVAIGLDRPYFLKALHRGWIRIHHGGGSSMEAIVKARSADRRQTFRMWAIFDSDALVPGEPSGEAARKVEACDKAGVRHHMLARRAIENYLPPSAIEEYIPHRHHYPPRRKTLGAFRRLQPEQRAHYNMKAGFEGDAPRLDPGGSDAHLRARVATLYATVGLADRPQLAEGFGPQIAEMFGPPTTTWFGISEAKLRADGQDGEMLPLFRSIVRSL